VIPAPFDYLRAGSVDEALAALAEHGDEAKLLAGGHSLLPLMKLRLAVPSVVVDIGRLDGELAYIRDADDHLAIGPLTRHRELETSDLLARELPLLRRAAGTIGDPQVRHRGTIGGSVVHGDPASDLPAVLLAAGATLVVQGHEGAREIPADDFFTGFLDTALESSELLTEIRVPKAAGAGWSFQKFTRRAHDWAIVGVACLRTADRAGIGLVNMAAQPLRATASEQALAAGATTDDAASVADEGTEPPVDLNATEEFRRHLVRVLVRRALEEAEASP
jgi:aerobic carbon-monoxide dehydrogenase medium subunit